MRRIVLIESVMGMNDLDSIRKLFLWKIQLIYQRNQRNSPFPHMLTLFSYLIFFVIHFLNCDLNYDWFDGLVRLRYLADLALGQLIF